MRLIPPRGFACLSSAQCTGLALGAPERVVAEVPRDPRGEGPTPVHVCAQTLRPSASPEPASSLKPTPQAPPRHMWPRARRPSCPSVREPGRTSEGSHGACRVSPARGRPPVSQMVWPDAASWLPQCGRPELGRKRPPRLGSRHLALPRTQRQTRMVTAPSDAPASGRGAAPCVPRGSRSGGSRGAADVPSALIRDLS